MKIWQDNIYAEFGQTEKIQLYQPQPSKEKYAK